MGAAKIFGLFAKIRKMFDEDSRGTLVFSLDGIPVYISGRISEDEAYAIADGIVKMK